MLHGLFEGVEVALLVLILLILALAVLAARRRWLARKGGTFECSLRLSASTPGTGWVLGVARYSGEKLEWYRFFSYRFAPRMSFSRHRFQVLTSRAPDAVEAVALYSGQQVVRLEERTTAARQSQRGPESWELAMSGDSLTGLMSWLEAAPPGAAAPHT